MRYWRSFTKMGDTLGGFRFLRLIMAGMLLVFLRADAAPLQVILVPEDAEKRVLVPHEDVADEWRSLPIFNDSTWLRCSGLPGGIGFDRQGDYNRYISLDLAGLMAGQTGCYIRTVFELSADVLRELDDLALYVRYDDGFVAFLNGEPVVSANAPRVLHRRATASQAHEAQGMDVYPLKPFIGRLKSGANLLAVHALNVSGDSPDFFIQFKLIARKNYLRNFTANLPIVVLQTPHPVPAAGVETSLKFIDRGADNRLTLPAALTADVRISRQESLYSFEKADYRLSFRADIELPGFAAGDQWLLIAPYSDKSLLRTALMSHLARLLKRPAAHGRLCHLFLNEDYRGIYVLMESRTVHPNRLPLHVLRPEDNAGDALTGGYLLRLDHCRRQPGFDSPLLPFPQAPFPVRYLYETPTAENLTATQRDYIRRFMEKIEAVAADPKNTDALEMLDLSSFADYFLLAEISKDVHAFRDFSLFYKDRDSRDGRLTVDLQVDGRHAFGNTALLQGELVQGFQLDVLLNHPQARLDSMVTPAWWKRLRNDARFQEIVRRRWTTLRERELSEEALFTTADSLYRIVAPEQVLNFERWMILDKPIAPSAASYAGYDEAFDDLLIWFFDRLDWLDEAMRTFTGLVEHGEAEGEQMYQLQPSPNPFNPATSFVYYLPAAQEISLIVYDLKCRKVCTLFRGIQPPGEHIVRWNGTDENGVKAASGVYFGVLQSRNIFISRKITLLR